jgi:hypothetical protein
MITSKHTQNRALTGNLTQKENILSWDFFYHDGRIKFTLLLEWSNLFSEPKGHAISSFHPPSLPLSLLLSLLPPLLLSFSFFLLQGLSM